MRIRTPTGDSTRSALVRGLDVSCLAAAFAITATVASRVARVGMFVWPGPAPSDILAWPAQYVVLLLTAIIAWNTVGAYLGIYQPDESHSPTEISQLGRAACLCATAIGAAIFLFKLPNVSRLFVVSFVSLGIILIALRDYLERLLGRLNQGDQHRVAIVVGNGAQADWLIQYLRKHFCPKPYALVRRPDADENIESHTNGTQTVDALSGTRRSRTSFEVFVAAADMSEDACSLIPQLLKQGVKTHIIPAVFDASMFRLVLSDIGGVPLVTVRSGEIDGLEAVIKRAIDFTGALLMLTLAAPLMIILAVLVKMSSPGPILFRQERLGKDGRRMYIYKFRTMRSNAESILKMNKRLYSEYVKNNYKLPQGRDPRITPLGRVLRQMSLDELPQLINVLKGEMSLVGPRPVVPEEIEQYGDCASLLLSVPPGLTGQWQVSGRSDIADYAQRVKLDMEYLRDQSVATDLRILLRTLPAVLLRQGAH
jgi:exopolysaccharide production protein ExoY